MEDVVYPGRDDGIDDVEEEDEDGEIEYGDDEIGSDHTSETSQDDDDDGHADGDIDVISEASHSHPWHTDAPEDDEGEESVDGDDIEDEMDQDEALWEVSAYPTKLNIICSWRTKHINRMIPKPWMTLLAMSWTTLMRKLNYNKVT